MFWLLEAAVVNSFTICNLHIKRSTETTETYES